MKKFLKWLAYSAALAIALLSIVAGVTQTQMFRDKLRTFALSKLDSLLDAEVFLGEIRGNLISGFSIDSVSIRVQNENFVSAERLDIKYDLFQLPSRRINVSSLTLVHPSIALLRGRDSTWNFVRMVRPAPEDSTRNPFDWPISVDRFEIKNGLARIVDSASLAASGHILSGPYFVEYHDVSVHDLNLVVTAAVITPESKHLKINSFSCTSDTPDIQLKQLSGEFQVTSRNAAVKNLVVRTARSSLTLSASMQNVDLLGGIELSELQSKPIEVSLRTTDLDLGELKRFIHQLDFLNGKVRSELVADGEFGRIQVKQLDLKTRDSELHFAGVVSNLHVPSKLLLNVKCRESKVAYKDVLALMPSLDLPDLSFLGRSTVSFDFDGEPLDFRTALNLQTDAGAISTSGVSLKIGGPERLRYDGVLAVRQLRLAPFLQEGKYDGEFNATIKINGYGSTLDGLNANIEAGVDSSEFDGTRIGPSRATLASFNRKISGNMSLAMGGMKSQLHVELDRSASAEPAFVVNGKVASLNLADFLHDESQASSITMDVDAQGTGLDLGKLSGSAALKLSSSVYKEYHVDSSNVDIAIDQHDPAHSSISLKSELADFSINGQFDLDYVVGLIRYEVRSLRFAVGQRLKSLDSTLATSFDEKALLASGKSLAQQNKVLSTEYELTVKNLEPISILTGNRTFNATGTIKGTLKGNYDVLAGDARAQLKEFFYGNADSGMLVQDGIATLRFNDLKPDNPLSDLTLRIRADAAKIHINRTRVDTLNFGIFYDKEYAGFAAQCDYERVAHLKTNGQVSVTDDGLQFLLSSFFVGYKDFSWNADDGMLVGINQNGLRIQHAVLRKDSQSVAIEGSLLSGGTLDATIKGKGLNLEGLKYVLRKEENSRDNRSFEGLASLDVHAGGTLAEPLYDVILRAHQVQYHGFPFGEIYGNLSYKDRALTTALLIDNRSNQAVGVPDLSVKGVLPINLSLKHVDERLSNDPMNFTVYSDSLQMSLLDPLLPTFNDLTGILKADFRIGGTPKKPNFTGSMNIERCTFLFVPNNMYYKLDGVFQPQGERIKVVQAAIRNIDSDNRPGRIGLVNVSGDFALSELIPSDFNFDISGQLLVVNKNTRTSDLAVYGDLPVEVAQKGLRFTGNVEHSLLKGDVLVRNSALAFPPTSSMAKEDTFFIPMKIVNDTLKPAAPETRRGASRYFTSVGHRRDTSRTSLVEVRTPSFVDGLRYDLNVEFSGSNNEVRMIFNPATNEELVSSITGQVAITEDGKSWNGTLDVTRATYNFYGKRFDAEGTISYAGDFLNPELNIVATYKGTRKYNDAAKEENIAVTYKITGTRLAPKSDISMKIDDVDYYAYKGPSPTSNDVQSDALTFVITNNFPLSRGERNNIADQVGPTVGAGLVGGATSLLTGTLAEFLRNQTGFINQFEVRYGGGSLGQNADVRLGGTVFKGYWRYGGKILEDPFSNANFSILYSFGDIFDRPSLRNFMLELERTVDTSTLFGSIETRKEMNSARFFYRFSF